AGAALAGEPAFGLGEVQPPLPGDRPVAVDGRRLASEVAGPVSLDTLGGQRARQREGGARPELGVGDQVCGPQLRAQCHDRTPPAIGGRLFIPRPACACPAIGATAPGAAPAQRRREPRRRRANRAATSSITAEGGADRPPSRQPQPESPGTAAEAPSLPPSRAAPSGAPPSRGPPSGAPASGTVTSMVKGWLASG